MFYLYHTAKKLNDNKKNYLLDFYGNKSIYTEKEAEIQLSIFQNTEYTAWHKESILDADLVHLKTQAY